LAGYKSFIKLAKLSLLLRFYLTELFPVAVKLFYMLLFPEFPRSVFILLGLADYFPTDGVLIIYLFYSTGGAGTIYLFIFCYLVVITPPLLGAIALRVIGGVY